jgi:hypothetical protein
VTASDFGFRGISAANGLSEFRDHGPGRGPAIGDWWAAPLLVVAAMLFLAMFHVLRIAQG